MFRRFYIFSNRNLTLVRQNVVEVNVVVQIFFLRILQICQIKVNHFIKATFNNASDLAFNVILVRVI